MRITLRPALRSNYSPLEEESQKPSRSLSLLVLELVEGLSKGPAKGRRRRPELVEGLLNSGHFDKLNDHAFFGFLDVYKTGVGRPITCPVPVPEPCPEFVEGPGDG